MILVTKTSDQTRQRGMCACVLFFFVFFFLIFNFKLCACLLFAVCDKWADFRGGDAVQQCNTLLMFYVKYIVPVSCIIRFRLGIHQA